MKTNLVIIVNRQAIPDNVPSRILVTPWGTVESNNGDFVIDERSAADILADFKAHKTEIPIDREHQTVGGKHLSPAGDAPAMGWITALHAVPGEGIYADVTWTPRGTEYVKNREYRYLSPGLLHEKGDNRPKALDHVSLTNKPAIVGMPSLNSREVIGTHALSPEIWTQARYWLNLPTTATESEIMDGLIKLLDQLREMVGADSKADQATVLTTLKSRLEEASDLRLKLCSATGKDAKTVKTEDLVLAVHALAKGDPAKVTPNEEVKRLSDELASTRKSLLSIHAKGFIEQGVDQGRISEGTKQAWTERYMANPEDATKAIELVPEGTFPKPGRVFGHSAAGGSKPVTGGDERKTIIHSARTEFQANQGTIPCDARAYINEVLREHGHKPLSDEEVRTHAA